MPNGSPRFTLILTKQAEKQLNYLPISTRRQYQKAFALFCQEGASYRSLRTHRHRKKGENLWSSSASMSKRFYWHYTTNRTVVVIKIDSH
ncbi:MAG: hypothetical protein SAL07_22810 [Oscillatoria sp. PMC 1051.18]|nr:hypothetical protein [Oscillatoria sp. PMC 1050.18]MEC5032742.1 hypothetical protein [Oscillatoria sp. PMC 1051.18]